MPQRKIIVKKMDILPESIETFVKDINLDRDHIIRHSVSTILSHGNSNEDENNEEESRGRSRSRSRSRSESGGSNSDFKDGNPVFQNPRFPDIVNPKSTSNRFITESKSQFRKHKILASSGRRFE